MVKGVGVRGERPPVDEAAAAGFRHEAFLYAGEAEFLDGTTAFVRDGLAAGEPVLVVVGPAKLGRLRRRLGPAAAHVEFLDMAEVGRNPARIIPAWRQYLSAHRPGQPVRGIGEPIWASHGPDELVEGQHHEALLNVAFADTPGLSLLCPYDVAALAPALIDEARRTHPIVSHLGCTDRSPSYLRLPRRTKPLSGPLPEPNGAPSTLVFASAGLAEVRDLVRRQARRAGLAPRRAADLVLAVDEVAANSIRHGGGGGTLRVWDDEDALVCEIRDAGTVRDAMVGRERPRLLARTGRGLWLANQLCDLVQLRSSPAGTTVRLAMRRRDARS
jgi:anti-sigma regulatory factor (Ser/Thr protein kinase)